MPAPQKAQQQPLDLCDLDEALRLLGGTRPLSRSTFYLGMQHKRFPRPIHIGPGQGSARWLRSELEVCKLAALEARDAAKR